MNRRLFARVISGAAFIGASIFQLGAQQHQIVWTAEEKPIAERIQHLREVPDAERARVTKELAIEIRRLPATPNRLTLAVDLASLSTEGDFGQDTLQQVATTLAVSLREHPLPAGKGQPAMPYIELARLVRYEHVKVQLNAPQFASALSRLEAADRIRERADFTLRDLHGKTWTLKSLRGKVALVNFWATWCPPCRKEIPDLQALYERFHAQGLVILAISDEDASKVAPFVAQHKIAYPVLLDPGRKVNELFQIEGIPKSFLYNRRGQLIAEAIDMRTREQFLRMLARAGLR